MAGMGRVATPARHRGLLPAIVPGAMDGQREYCEEDRIRPRVGSYPNREKMATRTVRNRSNLARGRATRLVGLRAYRAARRRRPASRARSNIVQVFDALFGHVRLGDLVDLVHPDVTGVVGIPLLHIDVRWRLFPGPALVHVDFVRPFLPQP